VFVIENKLKESRLVFRIKVIQAVCLDGRKGRNENHRELCRPFVVPSAASCLWSSQQRVSFCMEARYERWIVCCELRNDAPNREIDPLFVCDEWLLYPDHSRRSVTCIVHVLLLPSESGKLLRIEIILLPCLLKSYRRETK
jgi:hypothetical protein